MNNITELRPPFAGLKGRNAHELFATLPTPCYVIDEAQLQKNGEILLGVQLRTGCKILLAQKAFSNFTLYPVLAPYLAGTEASGLFEARLGREEMPDGEVHVFCAAYKANEFDKLLNYADHIVFNSPRQLQLFGPKAKEAGKSLGLRLNPQCSTQSGHEIYDPCAPGSRLGVTRQQWDAAMTPELFELLDGLHFHTLCEQNSDALEITLDALKQQFGEFLPQMKWLNFGGGHHITNPEYDIPRLERCITDMQCQTGATIYLEPGEACALNSGYMITEVLDIPKASGIQSVILDMSAACHAPDIIEMPYRPPIYGASDVGDKPYNCRLGGPSCLAGDVIGDYSFEKSLHEGDRLIFGDMAIYTTCKNNTFNGIPLPDIYVMRLDGTFELIAHFGYNDFKKRLG